MNLQDSDFVLLGLPQQFALDRAELDARWKDLQREVHPDRFAAQGDAAQRLAMQWSVRVNEAYQRLKDPIRRAAYLCELGGAPVDAHTNTAMPAAFLMQQMEWREALEDAGSLKSLEDLLATVEAQRKLLLQQCEALLDQQHAPAEARAPVRALMFIEKFARDLHQRFDEFE